jgi:NADH-quinone oxidoreductase subunit J
MLAICFLSFNFVIFKFDFIAIIFVIAYLGIILILFLFVLMLINLQKLIQTKDYAYSLLLQFFIFLFFALISFIFFFLIDVNLFNYSINLNLFYTKFSFLPKNINFVSSLNQVGLTMFNNYGAVIMLIGLLLLAAIIFVVNLLVKNESVYKKQNFYIQNYEEYYFYQNKTKLRDRILDFGMYFDINSILV